LCISHGAASDTELNSLWKKLGLDFLCYEDEVQIGEEEKRTNEYWLKCRARNNRIKAMNKEAPLTYGNNFGLSIFDDSIEFPTPIKLSQFKYFCTEHTCVDENCMTKEEEGSIDSITTHWTLDRR
jgi:hypothetical protein